MKGAATMFKETRTYDQVAKRYHHYQTVICSECQAFENVPMKGTRPMPPEPLIKNFQRKGWVMGVTRAHDICPACLKEAAAAKRREAGKRNRFTPDQPSEMPTAQIITLSAPKEQPAMRPVDMTAATQMPRQPQREDKRLIILEIENHYLGPDKGYSPGTTDETVAKSLNVPVKWVADLREEFFGPLVNPELTKLNAEVASLTARLEAHEREGRELRGKLMEIKERLFRATGGAK